MVGTLQPRKGYSAVLDAFDRLWAAGALHTLTIVGAPGWKTQALVTRIQQHPEFGKKLQWLDDADDSSLWDLYAGSDALIANSVAEGFGLPLVEAAQVGLPLIVTRIDPFVEIAGDHAFYIEPHDPAGVERAIREWCNLATQGIFPESRGVRVRTWDEVAHDALEILLDQSAETAFNDGFN
jgi:glycosyltransferase involved in cell wall biosynthesis